MSVFAGPADWWTDNTEEGKEHITTKGIVQSNIVLNLDAAITSSYPKEGTVWQDLVGNSNAILLNDVTYSQENLILDGTNDYIKTITRVPGTGTPTSSVTWCIWTKPFSSNGNIMSMSSTDPQGSWNMPPIAASSNRFRGKMWSNAYMFSPTYTLNTWYYVSLVFNYSATGTDRYQRLYVNGQPVAEQYNITYSASNVNNYLFFGQSNPGADNTGYYAGAYGAVQVYNKALTNQEIKQNFEATRGRYGI
jgi:hypothetical protein